MPKVDPAIKSPKSTMQILMEFFHHPHKALEGVMYDIDLWPVWSKITCPILVIHGTYSELLTPLIIKKMQRLNPQIAIYEMEEAGHAPALLEIREHEMIHNWLNSE